MAEETVNKCIEVCQLSPTSPCQTTGLLLDGAHDWSPTLFIRLIQDFGVDTPVRCDVMAVLYISYLTTDVDFLYCSVMDHCWSFQLEFRPDTTKSYVATEQRRSITLALTPSVASEVLDEQECQSIFHFSPHSQYSYLYSQSSLSAGGHRP